MLAGYQTPQTDHQQHFASIDSCADERTILSNEIQKSQKK